VFTTDNTTGFTAAELATLNAALATLQREAPEVDVKTWHDRLNNKWVPGITAEELVQAARVR
jgi:hypothetical protein